MRMAEEKSEHEKLTGRDRDNCVSDLLSKVCLSSLLHLAENHSANFLRSLQAQSVMHEYM